MGKIQLQIKDNLNAAVRAKQADEVSVLRMLLAAIKNKEIELKNRDQEGLADDEVIGVIQSEIKKRRDSVVAYRDGAREELARKEEAEIEVLGHYLPEQLSDDEIEIIVREIADSLGDVSPAAFGKVMGQAMARVKGKADGSQVSAIVKKVLNG